MHTIMESLNLNINVSNASYQPVSLSIFVSSCSKRRYSLAEFRTLLFQYDDKYNVSVNDYIAVVSDTSFAFDNLLLEYVYEAALYDINKPKFGLIAIWTYLNNADPNFQIAFLNGITNNVKYLKSVILQLFNISEKAPGGGPEAATIAATEQNGNNNVQYDSTTARQKRSKQFQVFFTNLSSFMFNANFSRSDLVKELEYFAAALVEQISSFNASIDKESNQAIIGTNNDSNERRKKKENLFTIPKEFIELLYEFNIKLLNRYPELNYLCANLEDHVKNYYSNLKRISSLLIPSSSKNTTKVLKLVWLNGVLENLKSNDDFFLLNFETTLKNELKILSTRSSSNDLKLLVNSLIQTSIEGFCISIVNKAPLTILERWKLFIEKQMPLLILRLKEFKGAGFARLSRMENGTGGLPDGAIIGLRNSSLILQAQDNKNIDIANGTNIPGTSLNISGTDSREDTEAELDEALSLSQTSKSVFSPIIQSAVVETISNLDSKIIKILKLFASEDNEAKNESIITTSAKVPIIDYSKYLEQNEENDMFASFPSTIIDIRHEFLRSCIALRLIKIDDFTICLKDDAKAEHRLLNTDDIIKDINTGETVHDLKNYINEIFLSKNPEFDAVSSSALARFLFQVPGFEATSQYQFALIIYQTFKDLIFQKKNIYLRRLSLSLLLHLKTLDIVVLYIEPLRLIKQILNYLDNWQADEEDLNFQDTFTDFGSMFLLLVFLVKRYNVTLEQLLLLKTDHSSYSFCIDSLSNFGNLDGFNTESLDKNNQSMVNEDLIDGWINALFDSSSGISDELMSKSSVKQCFKLIPMIFKQAFLAYKENLIDLDTFKGGVEYFFQPFLLVPLLGIFNWLEDLVWCFSPISSAKDKKTFELILNVINYLLVPVVNEEAKVIHNIILQFVAPSLFQTINKTAEVYNNNPQTSEKDKISINSKISQLLTSIINKNDYLFNLKLTASNKFFTNSELALYYTIKLTNGDVNKQVNYNKTHQYSKFESHPPLLMLEEQINSLVIWSHSHSYTHTPTASFLIPHYDPVLVSLATRTVGSENVVSFFINTIMSYEELLSGLYRNKGISVMTSSLSATTTTAAAGVAGTGAANGATSAGGSAANVNNTANTKVPVNAKVELLKKQLFGKKANYNISKETALEIILVVVDILSIFIINHSIKYQVDRITYWQKFLKCEFGGDLLLLDDVDDKSNNNISEDVKMEIDEEQSLTDKNNNNNSSNGNSNSLISNNGESPNVGLIQIKDKEIKLSQGALTKAKIDKLQIQENQDDLFLAIKAQQCQFSLDDKNKNEDETAINEVEFGHRTKKRAKTNALVVENSHEYKVYLKRKRCFSLLLKNIGEILEKTVASKSE